MVSPGSSSLKMLSFPETPCFIVEERLLRRNLEILDSVRKRTGAKILLAQKAFSMYSVYPILAEVLDGTCSSSPDEARLGREYFPGEVHAFAAAYSEQDLRTLLPLCDHLVFNSFSQWERFRPITKEFEGKVSFGVRCNPEHSETETAIYDPCAPGSRLGILRSAFPATLPEGIEGLHFHTLCEKNSDALVRTLAAFEEKFGDLIPQMKWIDFGGGHHITRPDYDVDLLCDCINGFKERYPHIQVYLEPGEAIALNTGTLEATVLDLTWNHMDLAVLDASAAAHMPDVLEMPYRPNIVGAGMPGEKAYTYRLGGPSCLAGDVIGDYSFDEPLTPGTRLSFLDMAHYTMVKTNTFNGLRLPSIYLKKMDGTLQLIRKFSYEDFKSRL